MFPPYNVDARDARRRRSTRPGPDLQKTVEQVQKGLTTEVMQELNSRVDIDKQTPKQVAEEYLKESGLTN